MRESLRPYPKTKKNQRKTAKLISQWSRNSKPTAKAILRPAAIDGLSKRNTMKATMGLTSRESSRRQRLWILIFKLLVSLRWKLHKKPERAQANTCRHWARWWATRSARQLPSYKKSGLLLLRSTKKGTRVRTVKKLVRLNLHLTPKTKARSLPVVWIKDSPM